MKSYVFDTGALTQYFADNRQIVPLIQMIDREKFHGMVPTPILSEFYYKICQKMGNEVARIRFTSLRNSKLRIVELDDKLLIESGRIKCRYNFASLVDSFAAGLALLHKCPLVTTDGQLAEIQDLKIKKIEF